MKTDWKLLLPYYENSPTHIPDYGHETIFPLETINDIFEQLKDLVGKRKVFYIDNCLDSEVWTKVRNGNHHDDHIIGTITAIEKNVYKYGSPVHHIYAKVETDEKYDCLPLDRAYSLNIGLESCKNCWEPYPACADGWTPVDYKQPFSVKSCTVKGLYFKTLFNHNLERTALGDGLREYYSLMGMSMLMMIPGRSYM